MDTIQNLRREQTLIMIAQRLSTVEDCDSLNLLKHGEIVNVSSYSEFINVSDGFRQLAAVTSLS